MKNWPGKGVKGVCLLNSYLQEQSKDINIITGIPVVAQS